LPTSGGDSDCSKASKKRTPLAPWTQECRNSANVDRRLHMDAKQVQTDLLGRTRGFSNGGGGGGELEMGATLVSPPRQEEAPLPVDLKKAGASQGRDTLCSPLLSGCSAARVAHPFSPARASRSLHPSLPA
jgi:hypothetical protein